MDIVTSSPVGMTKSAIQNPSTGLQIFRFCVDQCNLSLLGIYQIILSWIPTAAQRGSQGFCAVAVDSTNVQSDQWCITFLVDVRSSGVIRPTLVQGSASPLGTLMQNHTVFSIQSAFHDIERIVYP